MFVERVKVKKKWLCEQYELNFKRENSSILLVKTFEKMIKNYINE